MIFAVFFFIGANVVVIVIIVVVNIDTNRDRRYRSGRFLADDYFTILYGEQWAFPTGSLQKEVYRPGDQHVLPRGTAKQYRMPDSAWALEYARGNILSMLPFGFADTFSSTLDFWTLFDTVAISAYGVIRELLRAY